MRSAVHATPVCAPCMISRPARCVLARTAFYVPCGARGARRSVVDDFGPASAASSPGAPFGVELSLGHPAFFAAGRTDRAPFDGRLPSAQRTEARLASFAPSPPVPLPRHAPAALGVSPPVGVPCSLPPVVAGALGLAAPLQAGCAKSSPGRGRMFAAPGAHAPRAAFGGASPVAFAFSLAVLVGHRRLLRVDGIRATGGGPARRLAGGSPLQGGFFTGTASCPTRGVPPRAGARCLGP